MPRRSRVCLCWRVTGSGAVVFLGVVLGVAVLQTTSVRTGATAGETACERLTSLRLPSTTITTAEAIAPGAFVPPVPSGAPNVPYARLPSFCRVTATLQPTRDSDIRIEVWLPVSGWNGRFQAVGNGAWAGSINYSRLTAAVASGYAGASTDTGHQGNTAAFAIGHPEKVIDLAHRAVHEMTVQGKALIDAYYGTPARLTLWNGCSTGGRQGITAASKYPNDFDGVIAGAPALHWMTLHTARLAINVLAHRTPDSEIPSDKYAMIHDAVLAACDATDGVTDGVIDNPEHCHFDPKTLTCQGADGPSCLTPAQVETATAFYAPVRNPTTGTVVMPALLQRGSELGWGTLAGPAPIWTALDAFRFLVFKDPNWDWHRFNPATDMDKAIQTDGGLLDDTDANLKPFFEHGGKLLLYHGWADPVVTPLNSVHYFHDVVQTLGQGVVGRNIQLYMMPGMGHCLGGLGPDTFDRMAAIEQFVATGKAPHQIIASHLTNGIVDRTRPLCPYGQTARWKGTGSTDEAANFSCGMN